jgi:hypothetical protein
MKRLLVIDGVVVVVLLGAIGLAVAERCSEAPIMRRRINVGSGDYLADHEPLLNRISLCFGQAIAVIIDSIALIF